MTDQGIQETARQRCLTLLTATLVARGDVPDALDPETVVKQVSVSTVHGFVEYMLNDGVITSGFRSLVFSWLRYGVSITPEDAKVLLAWATSYILRGELADFRSPDAGTIWQANTWAQDMLKQFRKQAALEDIKKMKKGTS